MASPVTPSISLGNFIRERRIACGLTQAQLAHKVAISQQTLSAVELGERALTLERRLDFARALDVPLYDLIISRDDLMSVLEPAAELFGVKPDFLIRAVTRAMAPVELRSVFKLPDDTP